MEDHIKTWWNAGEDKKEKLMSNNFGIDNEDVKKFWEGDGWKSGKVTPTVVRVIDQPLLFKAIGLNWLSKICHEANKKWWLDLETGEPIDRNVGELLMLMVSELAEAMEGDRKDLMDDKLPHRKSVEVELADCLIRIFDFAGGKGLDLQGAFDEKMAYNAKREDHKTENRKKEGGKKY